MPSAYEGTDIITSVTCNKVLSTGQVLISYLQRKYIIRQCRISYHVSDISLKIITEYNKPDSHQMLRRTHCKLSGLLISENQKITYSYMEAEVGCSLNSVNLIYSVHSESLL